ncbi:hypothetical protein HSBAA_66320 [Vreelandella sulfidaeris]|uniref:Cytochrome c domain-containing protein n=1 Tax=Vreelandella sulfidaeris TaxID=115553 RepID=A0A455UG97_9GAMM|nr:hypothetical protein HSBAA_66320 [Halomonas sulfidaeris]
MKAKLIMSGLAALGVMAGTTGAYAQDAARDAIAERLAPVGQLCLQGQDCGTAAAPAGDSASSGGDIDGEGIYGNVCSACHESGAAGAPVRGNEEAWAERTEQGFATLLEHAINGIGAMPLKVAIPNLSDEEVEAAVAHLVEPVMDVPELGGGDEAASEEAAPEEETAEQTAAAEDGAASEEGATAEQEVAASEDAASEDEASASDEAASGGSDLDGESLYASAGCSACHATGVAGSPKLGDADAWSARLEKGLMNFMPAPLTALALCPPKAATRTLQTKK